MVNSLTAVRVARPQQALVQMPFPPAHWLQDSPITCAGFPEPPRLLHGSQQSQDVRAQIFLTPFPE